MGLQPGSWFPRARSCDRGVQGRREASAAPADSGPGPGSAAPRPHSTRAFPDESTYRAITSRALSLNSGSVDRDQSVAFFGTSWRDVTMTRSTSASVISCGARWSPRPSRDVDAGVGDGQCRDDVSLVVSVAAGGVMELRGGRAARKDLRPLVQILLFLVHSGHAVGLCVLDEKAGVTTSPRSVSFAGSRGPAGGTPTGPSHRASSVACGRTRRIPPIPPNPPSRTRQPDPATAPHAAASQPSPPLCRRCMPISRRTGEAAQLLGY
ncbi:hypothetical protein NORO109296_13675 [Nocardiopsis rhodophaea]